MEQRVSDEPITECTAEVELTAGLIPCGASCKRVPFTGSEAPTFHLKGGGWFRDGY